MLNMITSVLSSASVRWFTVWNGTRVGEDVYGNVYYTAKPRAGYKNPRRWVLYRGEPEASLIPPEWHGWMHHQTNEVPQDHNPLRRKWQKPPLQNMTGSPQAYVPPGHVLRGAHRDTATGDYQAWSPPQ